MQIYGKRTCGVLRTGPGGPELAWYARLHLRTRQTLEYFLDVADSELASGTHSMEDKAILSEEIDYWRQELTASPLSSEEGRRDMFLKVQSVLKAVHGGTGNVSR